MEARWLKRKNDEGVEERFYPVTHVDSVVGYESPDSVNEALEEHINNKSNPHEVTAEQVGAVHVSKVFSNTDLDTLKKVIKIQIQLYKTSQVKMLITYQLNTITQSTLILNLN